MTDEQVERLIGELKQIREEVVELRQDVLQAAQLTNDPQNVAIRVAILLFVVMLILGLCNGAIGPY